MMTREMYRVWL